MAVPGYWKKNAGFTLFEIVIVVGILSVLSVVTVASFLSLQQRFALDSGANELATVLRLAQNRTVASDDNSRYGVYFNTGTDEYVLFKGATYATRTASADVTYDLDKIVEFSSLSLGGGNEVVFEKLTGGAEQSGSVAVRLKADNSQTKTIYVSGSGIIDFNPPAAASDAARTTDSRHVHFDYSRIINTASENLVLTFDGSVVETIPISQYLSGGEIVWSGTVTANGADQVVEIRTHRLNNPDTEFSIHRDRRYNSKTLRVTMSGDVSGYLMDYTANGSATTFTSIHTSNVTWQ